jgi:hypothetical protein
MIPKSRKSNAVRILKDPFPHCDTFCHFSVEFLSDDPQDPRNEPSGDPQKLFFTFWHLFAILEWSSLLKFFNTPNSSNPARILKDPFDTFSPFFSGFLIWWSPRPPNPN